MPDRNETVGSNAAEAVLLLNDNYFRAESCSTDCCSTARRSAASNDYILSVFNQNLSFKFKYFAFCLIVIHNVLSLFDFLVFIVCKNEIMMEKIAIDSLMMPI